MTSVFGTVINTSIAKTAMLQSGTSADILYMLALGDDIDIEIKSIPSA